MAKATATVYANNKTVLFEGLVADAEEYVRNNFPRVHDVDADPDFRVVTDPKDSAFELPPGHPQPESDSDDDIDLDTATVPELRDYAAANDIDIDGLRTKAEIRAAIDDAGEGE